jgi:short-subunit dehydrogenase
VKVTTNTKKINKKKVKIMTKTIFITGASRGFGRIWTEAFLKRGDNVIATARSISSLNDLSKTYEKSLLTIALDVTNRNQCIEAINTAYDHFGTLDVVINNAGFGLVGTVEEASEQEARDQFEVNVFGTLWITQACLPLMRKQGHGHIIQLSSLLGVATVPLMGPYNASKWAVEGLTESMVEEIKPFGIHTTLIEPIGYETDFGGTSSARSKDINAYDNFKKAQFEIFKNMLSGKPEATADTILKVVDSDNPPLRVFLGKTALPWVKQVYADRLFKWEQVNDWAVAAHG